MTALGEYREWRTKHEDASTRKADAAIAGVIAERDRAGRDVEYLTRKLEQVREGKQQAEADVEYWKHHYKDCKASDYRNAMAAQQAEAEVERLKARPRGIGDSDISALFDRAETAEKARAHTIEVLNDCYKAMGDMATRHDRLKAVLDSTVDMVAAARRQRDAAIVGLSAEIDACAHDRQLNGCSECERQPRCNLVGSRLRALR